MNKQDTPKKVFLRSFGWPMVPVARDDFEGHKEDKRFGMKELVRIVRGGNEEKI